ADTRRPLACRRTGHRPNRNGRRSGSRSADVRSPGFDGGTARSPGAPVLHPPVHPGPMSAESLRRGRDSKTPVDSASPPISGDQRGAVLERHAMGVDNPTMSTTLDRGIDRLDAALAAALSAAVDAGRLDLVATIAEELRARRLAA